MKADYYRLLEELQAIDFVLVELNLYLDTHPGDPQATQQYNKYCRIRDQLKKQYEAHFGPLQHFGRSCMDPRGQHWNEPPWPWQV
ncbi:spore coat protein CotJB [Paludifilum halophilum]|uniref:Spore coat protein CotJB n=1 Tax=Paludifilum halophilum TaxID=1642702 RepID=A0A235B9B9_9BACL|nr:spore coat protein CotJB [Paludifilum halophilum]OYD08900.1 spore coat protein CotJB [Paludifilum halophilum]